MIIKFIVGTFIISIILCIIFLFIINNDNIFYSFFGRQPSYYDYIVLILILIHSLIGLISFIYERIKKK